MRSVVALVTLFFLMITAPTAWADNGSRSGADPGPGVGSPSGSDGVRSYRTTGTPVSGDRGLLQSPLLRPGQYTDSIGPGQVRHYSFRVDAGTPYLATTMARQPGTRSSSSDSLETVVVDADGKTCQSSARVSAAHDGIEPLTAVSGTGGPVSAGGTGGTRCSKPGVYYLSVTRTDDPKSEASPLPLEVLYILEPPLASAVPNPLPEVPLGPVNNAGAAQQVRGSGSFSDATTLRSGTYRDTIRPGETVFYRVPVGWGQRLQYDVGFDPASYKNSLRVESAIYNPYRGQMSDESTSLYRSPEVLHLSTPTVDYTKRDSKDGVAVTRARLAGYYYIKIRMANEKELQIGQTEVPMNLVVNVLGTAVSSPQYVGGGVSGVAVGGPQPATSDQDVQNAAASMDDQVPWLGIGLGAGALVVGACAVVLGRRYAARAAQGDRPSR